MKTFRTVLIVLVCLVVIFLSIPFIAGLTRGFQTAARKAKTTPINQTITVEPLRVSTYMITPDPAQIPGWLTGTWRSVGKSANIPGAVDDTIVAFRFKDPNNQVIQQADHQTQGNFRARVAAPGTYSFEFDNSGLIRSSNRHIIITGTYLPD